MKWNVKNLGGGFLFFHWFEVVNEEKIASLKDIDREEF